MPSLEVRTVGFWPAKPLDVLNGLLGWASIELDDLRVNSVAVRRTRAGKYVLSFPKRRDREGHEFTLVKPTSEQAQQAIESHVLAELERRGVLPS